MDAQIEKVIAEPRCTCATVMDGPNYSLEHNENCPKHRPSAKIDDAAYERIRQENFAHMAAVAEESQAAPQPSDERAAQPTAEQMNEWDRSLVGDNSYRNVRRVLINAFKAGVAARASLERKPEGK